MNTMENINSFGVFILFLFLAMFFWRKLLDLILYFTPQCIKITGLVTEIYKEKYMEPIFFPYERDDFAETALSYPLSFGIKEEYFVKICTYEYIEYLVKIDKDMFSNLSVAKEVKLNCKKYSWSKYLNINKT